jgi:hypothetical protein
LTENIGKLQMKVVEYKSHSQTKRQEFYKLSQAITNAEKDFKSAENATQA